MGDGHVLSGLIRKRAEIAGELEAMQNRIRQLVVDIGNVDAAIHLFAPDLDLAEIKPKHLPPRHAAYSGELSRGIPDILRESAFPLHTKDIVLRVMAERQLDLADLRLVRIVHHRVGSALCRLRSRGLVVSSDRIGGTVTWRMNTEG